MADAKRLIPHPSCPIPHTPSLMPHTSSPRHALPFPAERDYAARMKANLPRLKSQFARMRSLVASGDEGLLVTCDAVSGWCPAEHVDHLAKVSTSIFDRILSKGVIDNPKPLSFIGRLILLIGWIPRGKGRSPEKLHGKRADHATLLASLSAAEALLARLDGFPLGNAPSVPHPRFGGLTPAQALRFVEVHNEHHLKIVRDITAAPSRQNAPRA